MKNSLLLLMMFVSLFGASSCTDYPEEMGADGEWAEDILFEPVITDNLSYKSTFTTTFYVYKAPNGIEGGGFSIDGEIVEGRIVKNGNQITITATCPKLRLGERYGILPYIVSDGLRFSDDYWNRMKYYEFKDVSPSYSSRSLQYKLNATSLDVYIPVRGNVDTSNLYVSLEDYDSHRYGPKSGCLCIKDDTYDRDYYIKATFENGEFPRRIYRVSVTGDGLYSGWYPQWSL